MSPTWLHLPDQPPADGATVWVRLYSWRTAPFHATWSLAGQTFTTTANALVLPWWTATAWRPL